MLGKALKDLPREQIVVATKVGRYGMDVFDFSAERVTRSVHESLARLQASILHHRLPCVQDASYLDYRVCSLLQIPYIDLIQTHDIEFTDLSQARVLLS